MLDYTTIKMLSLLVSPLIQVLILFGLGLCCIGGGRVRSGLSILCGAIAWLWICSTPYIATYLMSGLERDYPPASVQNLPVSDAIVLLGGAVRGRAANNTLADLSGVGDRVLYAAAAFHAGKAPKIVVTGGAQPGEIPEASLTRELLVALAVPSHSIVMEPRNRVTRDNRRYTGPRLERMGVKSILLVTSAFHMRRAMLVFEPLGLQVYPAATDYQVLVGDDLLVLSNFLPSVKALQRSSWAFHEFVGYWYYQP
jgi:uncharacterized SAM-binding protein YcdF (DUF218 family)